MGRNSSFDVTVAINPGNPINGCPGFGSASRRLPRCWSSLTMAAALGTHHESGTVSLPRNFYHVQDLSMVFDEGECSPH